MQCKPQSKVQDPSGPQTSPENLIQAKGPDEFDTPDLHH